MGSQKRNIMLYEQEIEKVKAAISEFPEGKLKWKKNKGYYQFYRCMENGDRQYLDKGNIKLLEQMSYKTYMETYLEELVARYKGMLYEDKAINRMKYTRESLLQADSAICQYIRSCHNDGNIEIGLSNWQDSSFEQSDYHPEKRIYNVSEGIKVRSKSESMIAAALQKFGIPFHYEEALHFHDLCIYPDFTIRHPKNGTVYYWEHGGLMDDRDYVSNFVRKLERYNNMGILLNKNLIVTTENVNNPLTEYEIRKVIKEYFSDDYILK